MADFSLRAVLSMDGSGFEAALTRARSAADRFSSTLAGRLLPYLGPSSILFGAKRLLDWGGKLSDTSRKIGVTTSFLQQMDFAGAQAGVSMDDLASSIFKLQVARTKALEGGRDGDVAKSFARLGVTFDDLKKSKIEDLFLAISRNVAGAVDPQQKVGDAVRVMGRTAQTVFPAMVDGLAAFADEAVRTGAIVDEALIGNLDNIGDEWAKLWRVMRGEAGNVLSKVLSFPQKWLLGNLEGSADPIKQLLGAFLAPALDPSRPGGAKSKPARKGVNWDEIFADQSKQKALTVSKFTQDQIQKIGGYVGGGSPDKAILIIREQLRQLVKIEGNTKRAADKPDPEDLGSWQP